MERQMHEGLPNSGNDSFRISLEKQLRASFLVGQSGTISCFAFHDVAKSSKIVLAEIRGLWWNCGRWER